MGGKEAEDLIYMGGKEAEDLECRGSGCQGNIKCYVLTSEGFLLPSLNSEDSS